MPPVESPNGVPRGRGTDRSVSHTLWLMVLSAGILLYRMPGPAPEVFIAHMGGPFWARKDEGAWSIPKGEYAAGADPLTEALREFEEEIGVPAPVGEYEALGSFRQSSAKTVTVFALESDVHVDEVRSNTFTVELPKGSGRMVEFPEVDRAEWFPLDTARVKIVKGQVAILDALERRLAG